jgi:NAD(P)H-hydrate repair Nnr-like enzyme with NAD(P)H-hydrate epimerase domain
VTESQLKVFQSTPGKEVEFRNLDTGRVRLILDALIGYGLQSAPQGIFAELIHWANGTRASIGELVLADIGIPAGDLPAYWRLV